MQPLNNLDVCILILTALSAVIALYRGLVREVLSVIGWVLAAFLVFYSLPVLTPFALKYIASPMMAGVVVALLVLIVFFVAWILGTDRLIGKIRKSKLSPLDRWLGLLFGVVRAVVIVILFNILISWILPDESQSGMFKDSRYFTMAGEYAEPLEKMIPPSTIDLIKDQSAKIGLGTAEPEKTEDDKSSEEKQPVKDTPDQENLNRLFDQLAQPQVAKVVTSKNSADKGNFDGYQKNETENLDRLIENESETPTQTSD